MSRYVSHASLSGPLDFFKSPEIGADIPTILPDGTTPDGRNAYARVVSKATVEAANDLQAVLNNKLSLMSVLNRPLFSIPATLKQRRFLERAIFQLKGEFLPAALAAINDYARPMPEIKQTIEGYLETIYKQIDVALGAEAALSTQAFFDRVVDEGQKLAEKGARVTAETVAKTVNKASKAAVGGLAQSPVIVAALALAGLFGAAYLVRSFK